MESLIVWIVIVAIGLVFEKVIKRGGSSSSAHSESPDMNIPEPFKGSWPHPEQFKVTWPTPTPVPAPAPAKAKKKKPKPHVSSYQPIANLPEEGGHIDIVNLEEEISQERVEPTVTPEISEHYQRWRNAIIDTQILQRKF